MAKILIVDDEADMRLALSNVLVEDGHTCEEAADGTAALAKIEHDAPDLVLLDIRMPGMDGVDILREIRKRGKTVPVIMVTGYGNVDSAVEVMQLGANHYLSKPFSNKDLLGTVRSVIDSPEDVREVQLQKSSTLKAKEEASRPVMPSGRLGLRLAGAVLAAAVAAVGVRLWSDSETGAYAVSYSHPTALVWVGDNLWTADWYSQSIYEHSLKGAALVTLRTVRLPKSHITGLAVANGSLYVADSWKKTIERRRLDPGLTLIESIPSPGPSPSGLYWDGRYLWTSDSSTSRFYQHDLDRHLSVLASYKAPGKSPSGMYRDTQYFWSSDADTRTLYQHRLDQELRVVAKYSLSALDAGSQALSCFTWKAGHIWLGRDGTAQILRRNISAFQKTLP